MATMTVKNAAGTDEVVEKPLAPGRAAAAASRPVALSNEDFAVIDNIETLIGATNTALGTLATQTTLAAMSAKLPAALGQTTMAGSVSVTIANNQSAVPVSLASLPALATGSNAIGSITNTSFGISGTLPAFAATPTFNIGTAPTITVTGALTDTQLRASALPTAQATTAAPTYTDASARPLSVDLAGNLRVVSSGGGTTQTFNTTPPTLTNGQTAPLQADTNGNLKVTIVSGGVGNNLSVGATGSAVPAQATYLGMIVGGNLTGLTGSANGLRVDGSAVTQPVSIATLPALATGANAIGSITNTSFGISGTLPAFAATPTFNLGTIAGVATETTLAALNTKTPALGQAVMASSQPVAIASNQSDVPVAIADVTATGSITTQNLVPTGVATAGSAIAVAPAGRAGLTIQVTGTYTGALSLQGMVDGTNWVTIGGTPLLNVATGALSATIASATVGIFQAEVSGFNQVRVTGLAAMTGTATVTLRASNEPALVGLDSPLPTGTNTIGAVNIAAAQTLATVTTVAAVTTLGNITGTVSLPTGAATAAKQPALGTAGTPSADVLTVQGAAAGTPMNIVGSSIVATASVTRPADTTAYAIGDLVANNVTAGSVTPLSFSVARVNAGTGIIRRIRATTTKTGLAGTEIFRVHLFQLTPTVTNGDNGAFSANGRAQGYIGFADITMSSVFNDGAFGAANVDLLFTAGAGVQTIFGLIEARTAYTPASGEVFAVSVEALRD